MGWLLMAVYKVGFIGFMNRVEDLMSGYRMVSGHDDR